MLFTELQISEPQLRAACKGLADLKRLQLKRKAKDFYLDFKALNETGTKAFFRQKTASRQKSFIRFLKAKDRSSLTDSLAILRLLTREPSVDGEKLCSGMHFHCVFATRQNNQC